MALLNKQVVKYTFVMVEVCHVRRTKAAMGRSTSNVAKELLSWNLDDDNFPSSMWIQARFLPILLANGFGVQAMEPIVAYCGHVMAVRSADYWEATPPDHKVGMAFKQRAWGVFADAAGMKIAPSPLSS